MAAASLLGCVALLDAAVETVAGGSPGRFWLAGLVAVYLIAVAVVVSRRRLRARVGWAPLATTTLLVLLGLVAAPMWPAGRVLGAIRMMGQPHQVLAYLASAAGVLIAVWRLLRMRSLPLALRSVALALGAYGVAAFAIGFAARTPYDALFHGEAIWTRLPAVLQGPVLGSLLIVPAALMLELIGALRRLRNPWRGQQVVALAMAVVMATSTFSPGAVPSGAAAARGAAGMATGGALAPPSAQEKAAPPPSTLPKVQPYDPQQAAQQTGGLVKEIDPAAFEVVARAARLGAGIDEAFTLVRDSVRYEAYQGVLRGASGAYLTRAANAADRSLLLASLLGAKNIRTRLVTGRLGQAEAARLFDRIFDPPAAGTGRTSATVEGAAAGDTPFMQRVSARARYDYGILRNAIGAQLPHATVPARDDVIGEIQRHVWVQAEVNGRWVDLDTAFRDAEVGRSYCPAEQTLEALPEEAYQHVTLRVSEERLSDGALERTKVAEKTYRVVDLLEVPVFVIHLPHAAGGGLLGGGASDEWTPVIWVDGTMERGQPVVFGEQKVDSGGILGGGESGATFVAEWFEMDLTLPDGRHDVTRRALVDRGTAVWRKSGHLSPEGLRPLARSQGGVHAAQAVYNVIFSAGGHDLAAAARTLDDMAQAMARGEGPSPETPFDSQLRLAAFQNLSWVLVTDQVIIPTLNDSSQYRLFADSPRVTIVTTGPDPWQADAPPFVLGDFCRDHLRGVARSEDGVGVAERKLWFATLQGALEHELAAAQAVAAFGDSATVMSTSRLLGSGTAVVVTAATAAGALAGNPELSARVGDALAQGAVVLVPQSLTTGSAAAWWEIAPGTADAHAVLESLSTEAGGAYGSAMKGSYGRGGSPNPNNYTNASKPKVWRVTRDGRIVEDKGSSHGGNEYVAVVREMPLTTIGWITLNAELFQWAFAIIVGALTLLLPAWNIWKLHHPQ